MIENLKKLLSLHRLDFAMLVERAALYSWVLSIASAMSLTRLAFYFNLPWWSKYHSWQELITAVLGVATLLSSHRKRVLPLIVVGSLVLLHAYANFYQPSLQPGIPIQDYVLAPGVSANWSFDVAKLYLLSVATYFPGALVLWKKILPNQLQPWNAHVKAIIFILAGLVGANLLVALVQSTWSISFLSAGSGTAVAAGRAPALLEDSGAAGVLFSTTSPFLLMLCMEKSNLKLHRFVLLLLGLLFLVLALKTGGRSAAIAAVAAIFWGVLITTFSGGFRISEIKYKITLSALVIIGLILAFRERPEVKNSISLIVGLIKNNLNLLAVMQQYDPVRYGHWMVQIKNISEDGLVGKGLGSFHAEFANAKGWLTQMAIPVYPDWPSSAYLTIVADLGIAGLFLLAACFLAFFSNLQSLRQEAQTNTVRLPLLAALTSLMLSFIIGVHIPNRSVAALSIGLCAGLFSITPANAKKAMQWCLVAATLCLLAGIVARVIQAPNSIAFRWREIGAPQKNFYFREKLNGFVGAWKAAKGEILVEQEQISFLTKNPLDKLPAVFEAELISNTNMRMRSYSIEIVANQSFPKTIDIPKNMCNMEPTFSEHCVLRYQLSPSWFYENYEMGVFVLD